MAVDGLVQNRGLLHAEALLHRDSFRMLAFVAGGIVDGTGYLTLDKALSQLEKSRDQREVGFSTADQTLDMVDSLITSARNAADGVVIGDLCELVRSASGSQRRKKNAIAKSFQEMVVPGMRTLRPLVDELPMRR
jgi:hypothetical protein